MPLLVKVKMYTYPAIVLSVVPTLLLTSANSMQAACLAVFCVSLIILMFVTCNRKEVKSAWNHSPSNTTWWLDKQCCSEFSAETLISSAETLTFSAKSLTSSAS